MAVAAIALTTKCGMVPSVSSGALEGESGIPLLVPVNARLLFSGTEIPAFPVQVGKYGMQVRANAPAQTLLKFGMDTLARQHSVQPTRF